MTSIFSGAHTGIKQMKSRQCSMSNHQLTMWLLLCRSVGRSLSRSPLLPSSPGTPCGPWRIRRVDGDESLCHSQFFRAPAAAAPSPLFRASSPSTRFLGRRTLQKALCKNPPLRSVSSSSSSLCLSNCAGENEAECKYAVCLQFCSFAVPTPFLDLRVFAVNYHFPLGICMFISDQPKQDLAASAGSEA